MSQKMTQYNTSWLIQGEYLTSQILHLKWFVFDEKQLEINF